MSTTRLGPDEEGLLVDPGAFDNITGSEWADRVFALVKPYGIAIPTEEMAKPVKVEGVGRGSQDATTLAKFPGAVMDISGLVHRVVWESPVVKDSSIPALWGVRSLREHRAILDMIGNKLLLCGPGDMKGGVPPGTWSLPIRLSPSGHLIIPFTCYAALMKQQQGERKEKRREPTRVFSIRWKKRFC